MNPPLRTTHLSNVAMIAADVTLTLRTRDRCDFRRIGNGHHEMCTVKAGHEDCDDSLLGSAPWTFLSSGRSGSITGTTVAIDGGITPTT
jgi:hypothetical protein